MNGKVRRFMQIENGVRQGCVLSLFNLYSEQVSKEIDDANEITIVGCNINNVRYDDETAIAKVRIE